MDQHLFQIDQCGAHRRDIRQTRADRVRPGPDQHRPGTWAAQRGPGAGYSIGGMAWGTVELEPEIRDWLEGLSTTQFATAAFYIDLLAEHGPLLSEPYTRQLDGKLRELRFRLGGQAVRVTYWIASGRRIVLLTVFVKTRMREIREIERAQRALQRCIAAAHTAGNDGEE